MEQHDSSVAAVLREHHNNNYKPQNSQSRKSNSIFKNKQAPPPPTNKSRWQKIRNYQPKILQELVSPLGNDSRYTDSRSKNDDHNSPLNNNSKAPFTIGDTNAPICTDSPAGGPFVTPKSVPSLPDKIQHISVTIVHHTEDLLRNNSRFDRSVSQRSDEEAFDIDFRNSDGNNVFDSGIDNPVFASLDGTDGVSSMQNGIMDLKLEVLKHDVNGNYPYIPTPDYNEEEVTLDFEEESGNCINHHENSAIYKKYDGEDFGKYLADDELEKSSQVLTAGQKYYANKVSHKPTYQNTNSKKGGKQKKIQTGNINKRNSMREFAFPDSKIGGYGDKIGNSALANGRHTKPEKDTNITNTSAQFSPGSGTGSYEEFLRERNGMSINNPTISENSKVDINDDSQQLDIYRHSKPKHMRNGQYSDEKPNMWQRLTWRFRKSINISTNIQDERL